MIALKKAITYIQEKNLNMSKNTANSLHSQNIIACIWDFDKTLIPEYMQAPIFDYFNIDSATFWKEVNQLPEIYKKRGIIVSKDTVYLNHLLNYVKNGNLKGLNNAKLKELGKDLKFYSGLPHFFKELQDSVKANPLYASHGITLEHYIISTGLAAMIRGSAIAPYVDDIYGCEFVENPIGPGFSIQNVFDLEHDVEISQIGVIVDNTIKTRFIFEINKGSNKNPEIDVNAKMSEEDRRIPIRNMIYIADGPSDVPVFSVVKNHGGKTFAVYNPENEEEFAQNDALLQSGRIHAYGPADYSKNSATSMWIKMHIDKISQRIVKERQNTLEERLSKPPKHLQPKEKKKADKVESLYEQVELI